MVRCGAIDLPVKVEFDMSKEEVNRIMEECRKKSLESKKRKERELQQSSLKKN